MATPVLQVQNLTKTFGSFTAVDAISFTVREGEILGLLGPNGAGKTTTIQMLLGLVTPSVGSISYFGKNLATEREYCLSRINYASADSQINMRLSVEQNFTIFAGLYGVKNIKARVNELLALLGVEQLKKKLFWHLSSGQKTRVMIAKALLNRPQLLLMDEPTAFLDVEIATKVTDLILELQKKEKISILYTSHRMDEVEKLCDRVIFLNHGKIIIEDTPMGLAKRSQRATLILFFEGSTQKVSTYLKTLKYEYTLKNKNRLEIVLPEERIPEVLFTLGKTIKITEISIEKPSLENAFLSLIAKGTV